LRTAGYILAGLAFASALLWHWVGRDNVWLMAIFGSSIVTGILLLTVNAIIRLKKGDLQLRPINAVKRAPIIFVIMVAVYGLAGVIFPATQIDWTETLIKCAVVSLTMAIYFSAYRKPA